MKSSIRKAIQLGIAVVFWLVVWVIVSRVVDSKVLLPSPGEVLKALGRLIVTGSFWKAVGNSFLHIVSGFIGAVAAGILLAVLSYRLTVLKLIISPVMRLIKAIPVASFIILILLWISSGALPFAISFLMVLPVIYVNVLTGIEGTDRKLLEMARVFRMKNINKVKYIFIPQITPYFLSACSVGLGFCWKSGIAAEVIGLSPSAIGRKLYDAKLYLMTDELFAWTVVIVIISVIFEKMVMLLLNRLLGNRDGSKK